MTHSRFPKTLQSIGEDDMRKDMAKVIVERPRQGRYTRIKKTPRDFEDCPSKEGMRKPYLNRKSLNENLNPLWRFLERNINRPWDKVYSEICENLKTTSTVQQHVRDHIKGHVLIDVYKVGRKIIHKAHRWDLEIAFGDLYVDPDSGLLRQYNKNKRQRYEREDPFLKEITQLFRSQYAVASGKHAVPEKNVDAKMRFALKDGILHQVFFNKVTEEWDIYQKLTATQARIDVRRLDFNNYQKVIAFFARYAKRLNGPYFDTLLMLYMKRSVQHEIDILAISLSLLSFESIGN
jgi:hypothetical protein